jgi:hypothetical protein
VNLKRTAIASAVLLATSLSLQANAAGSGLLENNSLTASFRTFYFNRDKDAGNADSEALAQALRLDYTSGYAYNLVGFDASLFSVGKLFDDRGEGGTGVLQTDADGSQGGYTKFGQALVKLKLGQNAELRAGRMVLATPLFNDSDSRATPSATQAVMATGRFSGVGLYGIWSDKATSKTEDDFEPYTDNTGNDYEVALIGGGYSFANSLALQLAYGEANNVLQQTYVNASYPVKLVGDMELLLDLHHYHGEADGAGALDSVGADYESDLTNLAARLKIDNAKLTLSWQGVNGDEYEQSWDGFSHDDNGLNTWNSVQRLDFDRAEEQSWQVRVDYAFKSEPGLTFMTRYVRGDGIRRTDGSEGKEWERDLELKYSFQSIEGLSLRLRNASVRSSETYNSDENRLILNYTIAVL